jgi:transcriptional regulator with XRE-family HTH domain
MTFIDLAEKAGVARPGLSRLNNGKQDATITHAARIAEAVRVPLPRLMESPRDFENWLRSAIAKPFAKEN